MTDSKEFHGETSEPLPVVMLQLTPEEFLYMQHMIAYAQSHIRGDTLTLLRVALLIADSEIFQDRTQHEALIEKLNAYAVTAFKDRGYSFYGPSTGKKV